MWEAGSAAHLISRDLPLAPDPLEANCSLAADVHSASFSCESRPEKEGAGAGWEPLSPAPQGPRGRVLRGDRGHCSVQHFLWEKASGRGGELPSSSRRAAEGKKGHFSVTSSSAALKLTDTEGVRAGRDTHHVHYRFIPLNHALSKEQPPNLRAPAQLWPCWWISTSCDIRGARAQAFAFSSCPSPLLPGRVLPFAEEDSSSPDLNATHPGPNPASLARERRSLGECGVLQRCVRRAETAVHVEVWTDGKRGQGLTRELGVTPQQGRRGSLEPCRSLCFGSAKC